MSEAGPSYEDLRVANADRRLQMELNYGGIFVNSMCNPGHIHMEWKNGGDLEDEIGQMRRLAAAFLELADALDKQRK